MGQFTCQLDPFKALPSIETVDLGWIGLGASPYQFKLIQIGSNEVELHASAWYHPISHCFEWYRNKEWEKRGQNKSRKTNQNCSAWGIPYQIGLKLDRFASLVWEPSLYWAKLALIMQNHLVSLGTSLCSLVSGGTMCSEKEGARNS